LRTLAVREAVFGPQSLRVATSHNLLCAVDLDLGELEEASAHCEKALEISQAAASDNRRTPLDSTEQLLGDLAQKRGKPGEALAHYQRGLEARLKMSGPDNPELVAFYLGLGEAQLSLGRAAEAKAALSRARELFGKAPADPKLTARADAATAKLNAS